jgi:hypothetical protein
MTRTRLTTSDQPVDPFEVESFERAEQGLGGNEADRSWHFPKEVSAMDEPAILDRHSHPNILRPREVSGQFDKSILTLREDLEYMPIGPLYGVKDLCDEVVWNALVE